MLEQKHSVCVEGLGISFSTGSLAKLANGSVTIKSGNTVVLVTATMATEVGESQDFFPLTVDYREKYSAAGRFPGGYVKREGKPSEKEILTSRLCDRPLRPLFPSGFLNEVQIIGLLMATDLVNEPDILMVNGASAALMCSDIPWSGPIGCVRIGEVNGEFIVNPNNDQLFESCLDLIYVGTRSNALMIEGSADQISEERFNEALTFAHNAIQPIIDAQESLAKLVNKQKTSFTPKAVDSKVFEYCEANIGETLKKLWFVADKKLRQIEVSGATSSVIKKGVEDGLFTDEKSAKSAIKPAIEALLEKICRSSILNDGKRLDGRGEKDLREISCEIDVLPKVVHGSAMFSRGETQTIVSATLGSGRDSQELDALTGGAQAKSFILHYNFPPFSVGEVGRFGFTNRREIGHGALAERSLLPVIPSEDEFPYSIRLVSDIMGSNGSTSMASVCGGSLALMDAGVPILAPVAGISVGIITKHDDDGKISSYRLITDILGDEDHFGDMDFKICGTENGITGFQLDLKISGLPLNIMKEAIYQNKDARLKILSIMNSAISTNRTDISQYAPKFATISINPDKIGALIGPGGKNIKRLVEQTGCQIDISDDNSGKISIYAKNGDSMKKVMDEILSMDKEIEQGKLYRGVVKSVKDFGVFVECLPGKEGLVHVSELANHRVENPSEICKVGDSIVVKCLGVDDRGKVKLSRKAAL